jgi:hypothetical protein
MKKRFLDLFFNDGEMVNLCVSKFDTSIMPKEFLSVDHGVLCCINPLKDTRRDENVSKFRSFLLEVDTMSLKDQLSYIDGLKVPYSCCIYSGNKSFHFGICLDEDLPNETIYRYIYQWILNIVKHADQNCKNPSRMIRFPDNIRPETGKKQSPYVIGKRTSLPDLYAWLSLHPDKKPIVEVRKEVCVDPNQKLAIPAWVMKKLVEGMDFGKSRNSQWFGIGCEFAKAGYEFEETLAILDQYFVEENDFNKKEWEVAVKQGFKHYGRGNGVSFR